jgi:hypothetical protein
LRFPTNEHRPTRSACVVLAALVALLLPARAASAQADPAASARVAALNDAGDWPRAAALGRVALAADTTRSAERCRLLVGVAYADLFRARPDSARATVATFDDECADVPVERAVRATVLRVRRVLGGASKDSIFRRPDPD